MASVAEQAEEVAACLERTAEHHGIAVVDRSITDGDAGAIPGRVPGSEAASASRGIAALSGLRMCPGAERQAIGGISPGQHAADAALRYSGTQQSTGS
jgi:hypothetical protein